MESFTNVAHVLKERGAYKVYVMATHGLLSAEAPRLIDDSEIDEVRSSCRSTSHEKICMLSFEFTAGCRNEHGAARIAEDA